jgi:hypothetical protein
MQQIKPECIVPEAEVVERGLTKLDPAHVILHVYGPAGGFYLAMESDKLVRLMESSAYDNVVNELDASERTAFAAMTVQHISRRTSAADFDQGVAVLLALYANLGDTLDKAQLSDIRGLLVFDGPDKFHLATYTIEDQKEFDRHWRDLYRASYPSPSGSLH